MCRRAVAASLLVLLAGACAGKAEFHAPKLIPHNRNLRYTHNVRLFGVSNGLLVAVARERNTNLVKVDVRYKVGAAEDPPGKAGLAHVVEHMLFTLRSKPGGPTLGDELGEVALFHNAYTNWDETHFTATAHRKHLRRLLQLERKRMAASCDHIDEALFRREQLVVKQELLQRGVPGGDVREPLRKLLFGADHAYTRSVAGTSAQVMALTRQDVCKFIADHYAPHRAIMVISGDVDASKLKRPVGRMFGPISHRALASRRPTRGFVAQRRTRIELGVRHPAVVLAFRAHTWGSATELKMRMLTEQLEAALSHVARGKSFIDGVASTRLGGYRGGAIAFVVSVTSKARQAEVVRLFRRAYAEAIVALADRPVRQALVSRWNSRVLRDVEPFGRRAVRLADYLQYTTNNRLMLSDLQTLRSIDLPSLQRAAEDYLHPDKASVVFVDPSTATGHRRLGAGVAAKHFEIDLWRNPVDKAQAHKPLPIPAQAGGLNTHELTLDNGLEVILVPDLSYPLIDARLVFPVGNLHDPKNKRGTATLAALLLEQDFERRFPVSAIGSLKWILGMGGEPDSEVGDRSTSFHMRGMSMYADGLLWLLHWRVVGGIYKDKTLERVRGVWRRSRREEQKDNRDVRLVFEAIYGKGHPYSEAQRPAQLDKIKVDDLRAFRRRHYHARGATLIVTGNFDRADIEKRVRRLFSRLPKGDARKPLSIPPSRSRAARYALMKAKVRQPRVLVAFPAAAGFAHHHAVRLVVAEMLRQRTRAIRTRLGATYGVSVDYTRSRGPNVLTITASLDANHAGKALSAIMSSVDELRRGVGLERTFVRARRKVLERLLASSVDSDTAGDKLEMLTTFGLAKNWNHDNARRVARLRIEAVRGLLARDLDAARAVIVAVGSRTDVRRLYRAAGLDDYKLLGAGAPAAAMR